VTSTRIYQDRLHRIRTATQAGTLHLWDNLPDYNKPRVDQFTAQAVPVVTNGQRLAVRATTAHFRRPGITPKVNPKQVTHVRRGVTPQEVYARPFGKVWKAMGDGKPLDEAINDGRSYLAALAVMDIAMSVRATYQEIGQQSDQITLWVRVADATACDICSASDGATYRDGNDMGLHPACGCTLEPGSSDSQPADDSAFTIHDSDELGALLYDARHSFAA
jgi:hypothetical protein